MADVTITDALLLFTKVNEKIVRRLEALEKESEASNIPSTGIGDNKIPDKLPDKLPVKKVDDIKPNNAILNKILGGLETTAKPQAITVPQISEPVAPANNVDVNENEEEKQTEIVEEVKPVYIEDFSDKAIKQLSKIIGKDVNKKSAEEKKKEGKGSILSSILDTFVSMGKGILSMGKGILSSFTGAIKLLGPLISSIGPLISAIGPAAAIAAAGFVGWEIGTYLDKKFQISDKIARSITSYTAASNTDSGSDTIKMGDNDELFNVEQFMKEKRDLERAAAVKNERTFEFKGNKYYVGDSRTKIPQLPPDTSGETKPPQVPTPNNAAPETDSTESSETGNILFDNILSSLKSTTNNKSQTPQLTNPPVNSIESQEPSLAAPKEVSVVSPQTIIPPPIKSVTDTNKPNEALKVTQESNSNFKTYAKGTHDLLAEQIKISTQTNKILYEVADKLKGDTNIVTTATTIANNYGNTSGIRELQGARSAA